MLVRPLDLIRHAEALGRAELMQGGQAGFVNLALEKAANISPAQAKKLGLGSFLYAGLFLAEGTGLWMRKRWGEWLTIIITSSLVPFEVYEICRHFSWIKVFVLALNVAVVLYLIYHIRKR